MTKSKPLPKKNLNDEDNLAIVNVYLLNKKNNIENHENVVVVVYSFDRTDFLGETEKKYNTLYLYDAYMDGDDFACSSVDTGWINSSSLKEVEENSSYLNSKDYTKVKIS